MSLIEDHFKLHKPPFPQTAEGHALLHHAGIKEAVERLRFAIDRDAIAVLSAESGCAKSTVLGCLARDLEPVDYHVVYSSLASLGPFGFIASLVAKLGLRVRRFKGEAAHDLIAHLRGLCKRAVVIVDEAHRLPDDSLEDLRLLTADSIQQKSPFALVLAGQPLLRERLSEPQHYALAQRVTVRVRRRPLTEGDVALFLDKHLRASGAQRTLFEPDAVLLLFQHSRGIPRLVQALALCALYAAATAGKKTVDADAVQQAILDQEAT